MFILLVTHNTFGIDLELAGVVWNLALCVGGGWMGYALVGALAWLGVRTCLPAAASTMDHGSLPAFARQTGWLVAASANNVIVDSSFGLEPQSGFIGIRLVRTLDF